jgi:hypothetical protein
LSIWLLLVAEEAAEPTLAEEAVLAAIEPELDFL